MAIDREGIAKSLYGGYAEVANSPIPSVMLGLRPRRQAVALRPGRRQGPARQGRRRGPVVDPQLVQRDVDDPRRRQAGRDRRLPVEGDRHQRHAQPRRLGDDPAGVAGQAAARRRDHRRAGVLLLRAGRASRCRSSRRSPPTRRSATPSSTPSPTPSTRRPTRTSAPSSAPSSPPCLTDELWGSGLVVVSSLAVTGANVASWTPHQGLPVRRRSPGSARSSRSCCATPSSGWPSRSSCCGSSSPSCSCSAGHRGTSPS